MRQLGQVGEAEIDDPGAARYQKHIVRLEITMHEPGPVDRGESLGDSGAKAPHRRFRHRATCADHLVQRQPWYELSSHPRGVIGGPVIDQPRDKGAPDALNRSDLPGEARLEIWRACKVGVHHLNRGKLVRLIDRARRVYSAKAAHAETRQYAEASYFGGVAVLAGLNHGQAHHSPSCSVRTLRESTKRSGPARTFLP